MEDQSFNQPPPLEGVGSGVVRGFKKGPVADQMKGMMNMFQIEDQPIESQMLANALDNVGLSPHPTAATGNEITDPFHK